MKSYVCGMWWDFILHKRCRCFSICFTITVTAVFRSRLQPASPLKPNGWQLDTRQQLIIEYIYIYILYVYIHTQVEIMHENSYWPSLTLQSLHWRACVVYFVILEGVPCSLNSGRQAFQMFGFRDHKVQVRETLSCNHGQEFQRNCCNKGWQCL